MIGASAGSLEALKDLVVQLPEDLPAAIFVVMHVRADAPSLLADILNERTPLTAKQAEDGQSIRHTLICVAPLDRQMLLSERHVRLTRGPRENRFRSAIGPLFRSAAATHRLRAIGVILPGALDDGTAGLADFKRCGGPAIIQDPKDALCRSMPPSAAACVEIDHAYPWRAWMRF